MQPPDRPHVSRTAAGPERPFQRPWGCLAGLAYVAVVLGFAAAGNDRAVLVGILVLVGVAWAAKLVAAIRGFWRMGCWLCGLFRRADDREL